MKNFKILFLCLSGVFFSCTDEDDSRERANFNLTISGLEDLGSNYVYEGWLVNGTDVVTSGRFTVNSSGQLSQTTFAVDREKLENATTFVLTIEPAVGDVPEPSDIHILAGNFSGNNGTLSISHSAALGSDFLSASGKYILATPTDGGMMTNEESGLWFLDNSSGSPMVGLNLPALPNGWRYEGWAVINGMPVSTGTFTTATGADTSASFSGASSGPAFPGEDFLMNAPSGLTFPTDLRGGLSVISIEPYPDNSATPFLLKPLVHTIPVNAAVHTVYNMNLNTVSFPTGSFNR